MRYAIQVGYQQPTCTGNAPHKARSRRVRPRSKQRRSDEVRARSAKGRTSSLPPYIDPRPSGQQRGACKPGMGAALTEQVVPGDRARIDQDLGRRDRSGTRPRGHNSGSARPVAREAQRRDRCPARGDRRARAQGTRGRGASQATRPRARKGCTAGEPGDRQRTRGAHGELQRARWSFERGEGPLGQDRSVERARGAAATCSLCAGAVCAHRERVRSFLLDGRLSRMADRAPPCERAIASLDRRAVQRGTRRGGGVDRDWSDRWRHRNDAVVVSPALGRSIRVQLGQSLGRPVDIPLACRTHADCEPGGSARVGDAWSADIARRSDRPRAGRGDCRGCLRSRRRARPLRRRATAAARDAGG